MNLKLIDHIILYLFLLCTSEYGPILQAQPTTRPADSLLAYGDSLFSQGHLTAAREIYQTLLKIDGTSIELRMKLGEIALAEEKWSDAGEEFQKVLDLEPNNLAAHYYCGICARETGKFKALLLRKLDWDKSRKHFHYVMKQDSCYRDVIYQYAILLRYREDYTNAIKMVQTQIRLRPDLITPQVKLFRFYRYFITHTDQAEAISWLKQQPYAPAQYAIAEKLRRVGNLSQADSVLSNMLRAPITMSRIPLYLSLARLYYEKNQPEQGQNYYLQAIHDIDSNIDADLMFEDVKYIVTDQELDTYRSLKSISDKRNFFRKVWVSRDPTPAAPVNYRLAEHYKRLLYAEKYYEYDGFRTWFNNPDKVGYLEFTRSFGVNEEFNDKGLIYIRHGKADEWAATVTENAPANESWLYFETRDTPRMTFHFVVDENATSLWRLTPIITHPELLEDRLTWDGIYYRLLRASDLERLSIAQEMAEMSRKSVIAGLTTDRHTWDRKIKSLEIPFSTATFRGRQGKTLLEIYYCFSLAPLADLKIKDRSVEIERGLAIHGQDWQPIDQRQDKLSLPITKSEFYVDLYRIEVKPDSYQVAFYLRPRHGNFLGGWKYREYVPNYSNSELSISDIELATRIDPVTTTNKFEKHGLSIIPNPTRLFSRKQPIYIYFEIYNLNQTDAGNTSFTIEYTITLLKSKQKSWLKLFGGGGKSSITTQIDREGKQEFSVEYLAIDVTRLTAGEYNLTIKVTDRNSGKTASQSRPIALF